MKHIIIATILTIATPAALHAGGDHSKKQAGPNGGRVITSIEHHYELFITPGRMVKLTFLDEGGKAIEVKEQTATAAGGDRANPTRMKFAKDGGALVSDKPLPEGKIVPLVLQVKTTPDAKAVAERISVNLADCPECDHKEYACTCGHGDDDHGHEEGDGHKH